MKPAIEYFGDRLIEITGRTSALSYRAYALIHEIVQDVTDPDYSSDLFLARKRDRTADARYRQEKIDFLKEEIEKCAGELAFLGKWDDMQMILGEFREAYLNA